MAAQAIANLAAATFFAFALRFSFVSKVPSALRIGAGCGISILVSVLGMRGVGVLTSGSFVLQPVTWQIVSVVDLQQQQQVIPAPERLMSDVDSCPFG